MKRILLLLTATIFSFNGYSQFTNPDFEILKNDGQAINWNPSFIIAIPIDSSCISLGMDSLYFTTTEAYSGERAMELRTGAYCGTVYAGNIRPTRPDSDTFFYSQSVLFEERPSVATFYYKFHTVQGDVAKFRVHLDAGDGTFVADAYHTITAETSNWTKASIPLTYYDAQNPAFLNMLFEIDNDTMLHYGSRFLIDNFKFEYPTKVDEFSTVQSSLTCYPVPAKNELHIRLGNDLKGTHASLRITDATGRIVKYHRAANISNNTIEISVDELAGGIYFLQVSADEYLANGKFVK